MGVLNRPSIQNDDVNGGAAVEFLFANGLPDAYGETIETISRANVDGAAARTKGKQANIFTVRTTRDVLDGAAVKTTRATFKQYQGKLVHFTFVWNNQPVLYQYVLCYSVRPQPPKGLMTAVGALDSNSTILIEDDWEFQLTYDATTG